MPTVKLSPDVDIFEADRNFPIRILRQDVPGLRPGDRLLVVRSLFTPERDSRHIREDLLEAEFLGLKGKKSLSLRVLSVNGRTLKTPREIGMREDSALRFMLKRKPRENETEFRSAFLHPKALPWSLETTDACSLLPTLYY